MKTRLAVSAVAGLLLSVAASGHSGVSAAAEHCDVVAQTGCGPGEKCAVVLDDSGGQRIACAPDGTVTVGGRCGSFAGVDDCVGGATCVDGICRQACNPGQPGSCPVLQTCTALGGIGVGACATLTSTTSAPAPDDPTSIAAVPTLDLADSPCDLLARVSGCGPGEKCTLMASADGSRAPACVPEGTGSVGAACSVDDIVGYDSCAGGTYCVQGTCQAFCDPAGLNTCPLNGTCAAFEDNIGLCAAPTSTAAAPAPDLAASTCDVLARITGCGPGEKCTLMAGDDGSRAPACVPEGTGSVGAACSVDDETGYDDCVGGTFCLQGTCQAFCDPAGLNTCPLNETCSAFERGIGLCAAPTSTTAAPPPTSSRTGCAQHQDCGAGTYCARDGACYPDSHRPLGVAASPRLRNLRSGRVCTGPDGTQSVCQEAIDIVIDGRDQCEFNHERVRCNWFGWEFDYEGFDPSIPIRCAWVRSMPADEGNRDGIRQVSATRGTSEFWLPGACGHFISPGFQNYATPPGRGRVVVSARFDCSYDDSPLFDVEYRFHFGR